MATAVPAASVTVHASGRRSRARPVHGTTPVAGRPTAPAGVHPPGRATRRGPFPGRRGRAPVPGHEVVGGAVLDRGRPGPVGGLRTLAPCPITEVVARPRLASAHKAVRALGVGALAALRPVAEVRNETRALARVAGVAEALAGLCGVFRDDTPIPVARPVVGGHRVTLRGGRPAHGPAPHVALQAPVDAVRLTFLRARQATVAVALIQAAIGEATPKVLVAEVAVLGQEERPATVGPGHARVSAEPGAVTPVPIAVGVADVGETAVLRRDEETVPTPSATVTLTTLVPRPVPGRVPSVVLASDVDGPDVAIPTTLKPALD